MSKNIDELPEGGRGITIMSHIVDELSYTRTHDCRNCLLMVKSYEQQSLDPSQALQKANVLEQGIEFFSRLNRFNDKHDQQQDCKTPLQIFQLQVNTDFHELDQIFPWFNQLEQLPIPKTVVWQCRLALAEGFTNAVRHAHKDLPLETPIDLEVKVFSESLEIRIWDCGQPFDLEAKLSESKKMEQKPLERQKQSEFKIWLPLSNYVNGKRIFRQQNYRRIVKRLLNFSTF